MSDDGHATNGRFAPGNGIGRTFAKGRSGNPAGRPKRKTLGERIAALLEATELEGVTIPDGMCIADLLARVIVREALKGKFLFAKEIWDRLEGKVPDRVVGPDGGAVIVKIIRGISFDDL